jgi:hypothetical protein
MIKPLSGRLSLFLLVRSHAQIQYYLKLSDSHRAANQGGPLNCSAASGGNVAEIHPISLATLRRRG